MITTNGIRKVWLALHKTDFRKGHDGLLGEAYRVGLDPFRGDCLVFVGRDRRRFKILFADTNGLWCAYKRFNKGALRGRFAFLAEPRCSEITSADLSMLLEGAHYTVHKRNDPWPKPT